MSCTCDSKYRRDGRLSLMACCMCMGGCAYMCSSEEFNKDSLKGSEHLRRCFHLRSLIRPLPRLELDGAVLAKM